MKIALSADFHLGIRQFNSQQRWRDFLDTFIKVTRKVGELKADVYVMAGDIFHNYRPHPGIVRLFLKEISALDCPVILIRGNHDSPQILFEKYGGDTLHLLHDVSKIIYLNRKNPSYTINDTSFIGLGYVSFNVPQEIKKRLEGIRTQAQTKIGIFHQLLDYPGVPENRAEVSIGFLKSLDLNYILMGHYHVAYSEPGIFNPGSPEYWSFDQAEQIIFNLDTGEIKVKPSKKRGFFMVNTENGEGEFIHVEPARPMFCITYETENFSEQNHLPKIQDHLQKFNLEGSMLKTIIKGRHKYGRINLTKKIGLKQPLIHNTAVMLSPTNSLTEKTDIAQAHIDFLIERGVPKSQAKILAQWLEQNKEKLAELQGNEMLQSLREILTRENCSPQE